MNIVFLFSKAMIWKSKVSDAGEMKLFANKSQVACNLTNAAYSHGSPFVYQWLLAMVAAMPAIVRMTSLIVLMVQLCIF